MGLSLILLLFPENKLCKVWMCPKDPPDTSKLEIVPLCHPHAKDNLVTEMLIPGAHGLTHHLL